MPERPNPDDVDQTRSAGYGADDPRDTPLRARVSEYAVVTPGLVDDMATTGRVFMWDPVPDHPAGRATAAHAITRALRERVPAWPVRVENLSWIIEDPDPDRRRGAVVATGQLSAPVSVKPAGPMIVGVANDVEMRIMLPARIDHGDVANILNALEAIGALPAGAPQ